jgi:hypothetical protein
MAELPIRKRYLAALLVATLLAVGSVVLPDQIRRTERLVILMSEFEQQGNASGRGGVREATNPNELSEIVNAAGWKSTGILHGQLQVGPWTSFDRSGTRRSEITYVDGRPGGPCRFWDDQGALRVEGAYATDIRGCMTRKGTWHYHDEEGRIFSVTALALWLSGD